MDPNIQNGLEDYLHGLNRNARPSPKPRGLMSQPVAADFERQLSQADAGTQREVAEIRQASGLLHSLQVNEDEVPQLNASFYARVMERIEAERAGNSFWSLFLNPQFSRRLLFASAALLVLLAVTLVTVDPNEGWFNTAAPQLVEAPAFEMQDDFAVATANQPIEAGLVSHSEAGHDQMLIELASYQ